VTSGSSTVPERPIAVTLEGEAVPAVLWTPRDVAAPVPVVLAGHGFSLRKRTLFPRTLPADLTGRHQDVPDTVFEEACDWLSERLGSRR